MVRIYRDDFDLLHDGMVRLATAEGWQVIERPAEGEEPPEKVPGLVTLESLGLARLRPVPEPVEDLDDETDGEEDLDTETDGEEDLDTETDGEEDLDDETNGEEDLEDETDGEDTET